MICVLCLLYMCSRVKQRQEKSVRDRGKEGTQEGRKERRKGGRKEGCDLRLNLHRALGQLFLFAPIIPFNE